MKGILKACFALLLVAIAGGTGTAIADDDHSRRLFIDRDVDTFAVLPVGVRFPEGITANPQNGDIYVGTFDAPPNNRPNKLLRFNRHGKLEAQRDFGNTPLLGLEFDGVNKKVYIASVGDFDGTGSRIQRVAADLTGLQDVASIPGIGAPTFRTVINPDTSIDTIYFGTGARVPNAMVLNKAGDLLYVSDSFQGAIFRISNPATCNPCSIVLISHDPLLATAGFPPFGANGLALSDDEKTLFIANTGDDRVLKLDPTVLPPTPNPVSIFAESINGADGLAIDGRGRVWVAANQADEVVALNENGKIVAKLGEFRGIRGNGTPDGLLFPASLVIVDDEIFVTNLALPLNGTAGDEPEEDVTRWTISRLKKPRH